MKRSIALKLKELDTKVCIVGSGPVGMVLSLMLNKFKIPNIILERSLSISCNIQYILIVLEHPKAHYLSFRTCEILKDLGLGNELEERLKSIDEWATFNY
jgi:2-polyprenyl-6-methoxyphenol hydroxylase-like FAD-dependent oxidoreductase